MSRDFLIKSVKKITVTEFRRNSLFFIRLGLCFRRYLLVLMELYYLLVKLLQPLY
jgi:hypothetical protein